MGKGRNPSKAATLEGRGTLARLLRTIEWLFGMVHESFHLRLSYVMTHIRQLIVFVFFFKDIGWSFAENIFQGEALGVFCAGYSQFLIYIRPVR